LKKKWLAVIGVVILVSIFAITAFSSDPIKLVVNGREIKPDVLPQVINGRTMVPIRWVAEALGADVQWDERNNAVVITKGISGVSDNELGKRKYYPQVSEKITTPEMALQAYFDALSVASNLQPAQMGAAGGTIGMGREPYQTAYSYWSKDWQTKNSYDEFVGSWEGVAHVELLKLLPAGEENGQRRFFVETKHIEAVGEKPRLGIFYYWGFFTVGETAEGWKITGGNLEPENLGWKLGGHQPWRGDPETVALVGLGHSIDAPLGETVIENNTNGTVNVKFVDSNMKETHRVILVQREDGIWQILEKQ